MSNSPEKQNPGGGQAKSGAVNDPHNIAFLTQHQGYRPHRLLLSLAKLTACKILKEAYCAPGGMK